MSTSNCQSTPICVNFCLRTSRGLPSRDPAWVVLLGAFGTPSSATGMCTNVLASPGPLRHLPHELHTSNLQVIVQRLPVNRFQPLLLSSTGFSSLMRFTELQLAFNTRALSSDGCHVSTSSTIPKITPADALVMFFFVSHSQKLHIWLHVSHAPSPTH